MKDDDETVPLLGPGESRTGLRFPLQPPSIPDNIFPSGAPTIREEDDFFAVQRSDFAFVDCRVHDAMPTSAINDRQVTFNIRAFDGPQFLFLNEAVLVMDAKLVDKDGNVPANDASIAPIHMFPTTMFRDVRLYLNDTEVSNSEDGAYPMRAWIETTLNYSREQMTTNQERFAVPMPHYEYTYQHTKKSDTEKNTPKEVILSRSFFGSFFPHATEKDDDGKPKKIFKYYDVPMRYFGRVLTNFSNCQRPIIPGVGVRVEMSFARPEFYLITDSETNLTDKRYHIQVDSVVLAVPYRQMNMEMYYNLGVHLTKNPVLYPMKRMSMKKFTLTKGQQNFTFNDLATGAKKPDRILLAFTPEKWWENVGTHHPLQSTSVFQTDAEDEPDKTGATTASMTAARLTVNALRVDPINSKNWNQLVLGGYHQLIRNLGLETVYDRAIGFTYQQYARRNFYLLFDLTQSGRAFDSSVRYATREGQLRLEVDFDKALPTTVNMFALAEFNASVKIDKNRNITYNFVT